MNTALTKAFWASIAPLDPFIGFFITQPLADALALKTFTHGTNFSNYLNIRCFGADPSKGGSTIRRLWNVNDDEELDSSSFVGRCQGYFYLFKDVSDISDKIIYTASYKSGERKVVEFIHGTLLRSNSDQEKIVDDYQNGSVITKETTELIPEYTCTQYRPPFDSWRIALPKTFNYHLERCKSQPIAKYLLRSIAPAQFAYASSLSTRISSSEEANAPPLSKWVLAIIEGIFTPTISIRVADEDPLLNDLEEDPDYQLAYKTRVHIPPDYIGLSGIIHQSIGRNPWERIQRSPIKATLGIARLAGLCAIVFSLYRHINH
jgi:hypothetical protein